MAFWSIIAFLFFFSSAVRGSKEETGFLNEDYKIHIGLCRELATNSTPDLLTLKGTWYLYAQTPKPLVSRCNNFTLLHDIRTGDYTLLEEFYSPVGMSQGGVSFRFGYSRYHTTTYNVDLDLTTNSLIFTQNLFGRVPIQTKWKVVDIVHDDFMLLYKCGAFSMLKESQMWVRNSHMATDFEPVPKEFQNSMKKVHFTPNDYYLKRNADCKQS